MVNNLHIRTHAGGPKHCPQKYTRGQSIPSMSSNWSNYKLGCVNQLSPGELLISGAVLAGNL